MIQINKNEWINPENLESMYIDEGGLQLFMASGRMIQIIDDVQRIMKEVEDWFDQDIKAEVPVVEPKPRRKYVRKVKKEGEPNG